MTPPDWRACKRISQKLIEIDFQLIAITHPGLVFAGDKLAFNVFSNNYLTELTPESGVEGTFYLHPNALGAVVLGELWANTAIVAPLNALTCQRLLCGVAAERRHDARDARNTIHRQADEFSRQQRRFIQ